jgi:opacity protein-like surface antigen
MKKLTLLASLSALVLTAVPALAGTTTRYDKNPAPMAPPPPVCGPWFSGLSGGAWWVQDYDVSIVGSGAPTDFSLEFETGFGVDVVPIGYRYNDNLSTFLEVGYRHADVDGFSVAGVNLPATGGELQMLPITLNANLNFPLTDGLSIYAGFGAGAVYRDLDIESGFLFPGLTFHDSGWNAIVQGRVGVQFEIAQCNFLNVGYRYQHVFGNPDDIQSHMAEVGWTFSW